MKQRVALRRWGRAVGLVILLSGLLGTFWGAESGLSQGTTQKTGVITVVCPPETVLSCTEDFRIEMQRVGERMISFGSKAKLLEQLFNDIAKVNETLAGLDELIKAIGALGAGPNALTPEAMNSLAEKIQAEGVKLIGADGLLARSRRVEGTANIIKGLDILGELSAMQTEYRKLQIKAKVPPSF